VLQHRVRYHEADAQGILFNSRYLEIADVAMTEYFRAQGLPYLTMVAGGTDPAVGTAQLRFLRPARFEDVLEVRAGCSRVGRSSFDLSILVACDEELVAEIDIAYVNLDASTGRSRPLPDAVAQLLRSDVDLDGSPAPS
jgi:acyl-CoA thioester hydrolase